MRLVGGHLGGGIGDVQVRGEAAAVARLRQFQAFLGGVDVVDGNGELGLDAAQLHIVAGHFRQDRQQRIAPRVLRGFDGGVGAFNLAAHAAPEIQLPRRVEAILPEIEGRDRLVAGDGVGNGAAAGAGFAIGGAAVAGEARATAGAAEQA